MIGKCKKNIQARIERNCVYIIPFDAQRHCKFRNAFTSFGCQQEFLRLKLRRNILKVINSVERTNSINFLHIPYLYVTVHAVHRGGKNRFTETRCKVQENVKATRNVIRLRKTYRLCHLFFIQEYLL